MGFIDRLLGRGRSNRESERIPETSRSYTNDPEVEQYYKRRAEHTKANLKREIQLQRLESNLERVKSERRRQNSFSSNLVGAVQRAVVKGVQRGVSSRIESGLAGRRPAPRRFKQKKKFRPSNVRRNSGYSVGW